MTTTLTMMQLAGAPRDNPEFCAFASKTFGWRVSDFAGNHGQVELAYRTWLATREDANAAAVEQHHESPYAIDEAHELESQQAWWSNFLSNNELASKNPALASREAWLYRAQSGPPKNVSATRWTEPT